VQCRAGRRRRRDLLGGGGFRLGSRSSFLPLLPPSFHSVGSVCSGKGRRVAARAGKCSRAPALGLYRAAGHGGGIGRRAEGSGRSDGAQGARLGLAGVVGWSRALGAPDFGPTPAKVALATSKAGKTGRRRHGARRGVQPKGQAWVQRRGSRTWQHPRARGRWRARRTAGMAGPAPSRAARRGSAFPLREEEQGRGRE
jgi:hypothetical protein